MIKLSDFNNICRLCLSKSDEHLVQLFSKSKIAENSIENDLLVAETVESVCNIKIRKGDGLPELICNQCWNVVSSILKLQTVSITSDRLLHNILDSHSSSAIKAVNKTDKTKGVEIEFIDTQSNIKQELLEESEANCSADDLTPVTLDRTVKTERNSKKTLHRTVKTERNSKKTFDRTVKTEQNCKEGKKKREKKTFCEVCGKLVASKFMQFHQNLHKDIRPYKCQSEDCEKYFISPDHAKKHFRKAHVYSITRPYKCDICGSGFIQKSSLVTHRTYHFDPEIPCTICGQLYRNTHALKRHLLVHSGERKYSCSECEKSFKTSFTLRIHMRTHTLEKPFACTECSQKFAYKCLLKAHTEKHHKKERG